MKQSLITLAKLETASVKSAQKPRHSDLILVDVKYIKSNS